MKTRIVMFFPVFLLVCLGSCSSTRPVNLNSKFWDQPQGKRVGVVLLGLPPAEIFEGSTNTSIIRVTEPDMFADTTSRDDAVYRPLRLAERQPLKEDLLELDAGEFSLVQDLFVEGFNRRGIAAFKVDRSITEESLPSYDRILAGQYYEKTDYRGLGKTYKADYLLVIRLVRYGTYCHYVYAFNDYMGVVAHAHAELVDVRTNRILWSTGGRQGVFERSVQASCGSEDDIPIISEALKGVLSDAAGALYVSFFSLQKNKD